MSTTLGLRANWKQFTLLVVVNAFVGGTVGIERTVLPALGEKDRGLAMGLNDFIGYLAVGAMALLTCYLATHYGPRPVPFQVWIALSVISLLLMLLWAKGTTHHVTTEAAKSALLKLKRLFVETSLTRRMLGNVT